MIPLEKQAAQLLEGMELEGGWRVIKKLYRSNENLNVVYSCCYEVEKASQKGFLKAFDLSAAAKVSLDATEQLRNILNAFSVERDILKICSDCKCTNIVELISYGSVEVKEAEKYPSVSYLILEYADAGDVKNKLEDGSVSLEWKLRSLHQLAKGLRQIHQLSIAHQDIKPSNVVTFNDNNTKLTDFGSAISLNIPENQLPEHLKKSYAGSWEYAPPELLYNEISKNEITRRIGCDLYLLGSMVVFYFTNANMTSIIRNNLDEGLCWTNQNNIGKYQELKAYLIAAFEQALIDVERQIHEDEIKPYLIKIIRYLCNPDPLKRGMKKP